MRPIAAALTVLCLIIVAGMGTTTHAQLGDLKIDPKVCENLQRQMDNMVAISQSPLSMEQKIEKLKQSWDQSWANVLGEAAEDQLTLQLMKRIGGTVARIMALVHAAQARGQQDASPEMEQSVDEMKKQARPVIGMMMMLCPTLRMPPALSDANEASRQ